MRPDTPRHAPAGTTSRRARRVRFGVAAVLSVASLQLGGCSQDGPTALPDPVGRSPAAKEAAATAAAGAPDKVCEGVATLFSQMRVQSVRWSPELQPFDPVMAAAVRNLAQDLAARGRAATSKPVRAQVAANVTALNRLGAAMGGGNAARVLADVRRMRVAYAALNAVCDPAAASTAAPSTPAPTRRPGPVPTPEPPGPTCRKVQGVMVEMGVVSAAWAPQAHPYDEATAARFRAFGDELAALAPGAGSARVRTTIQENAGTLAAIAQAMGSRDRSAVYDAIAHAQLAYADLRTDCALP